ncbi:hypothetical protein ACMXYN_02850 [Neptuniibacter sp. PT8_73]|uniref:hypothetical protein n=1 Tax=unclassified Neptuniibacter TaxID=2630693 RepID=UPI0039F71706
MTQNTSEKLIRPNEASFADICKILWDEKTIIIIAIALSTLIGIAYSYIKSTHTPTTNTPTNISITVTSSESSHHSLRMTEAWLSGVGTNLKFSTPKKFLYAPGESFYSPISLVIRFGEVLESENWKQRYINEKQLNKAETKALTKIKVTYPRAQKKSDFAGITLQTKTFKEQEITFEEYVRWSREYFITMILKETDLESIVNTISPTDIILINSSTKQDLSKPASQMVIITFSILIGIMISIFIIAIKRNPRIREHH